MHLFDSMRRYSRNSNSTSKERAAQSAQIPPLPTSPVISTNSRQPLLPETNLTLTSSRSSLVSEASSSRGTSRKDHQKLEKRRGQDGDISKATPKSGRSERSNTPSKVQDGPSASIPTTASSSQRSNDAHNPDFYTQYALNTFSFGAAASPPIQTQAIDPLSSGREDDSDEFPYKADTTPRPSLVASSSPRSHSSQLPAMQSQYTTSLPPPPRRSPTKTAERARKPSTSSHHTSAAPSTSASASASTSSLSSAALESSTGSRRGGSITTPLTSSNELTSDEDEGDHHHPIPHHQSPPTPSPFERIENPSGFVTVDNMFDDISDNDDDEYYNPDIDISSSIHEDSGAFFDNFPSQSRESLRSSFAPRRGSFAIPIPMQQSPEGRDREDSLATLRRPSRSLDGLRSESRAESLRHSDRQPISPTSVPESELRRFSIEKGMDRDHANRPPATPSIALTPPSTHPTSALQNYGLDWNIPSTGIVEWDLSEMQDIVGGINGPSSSDRPLPYRRGSSSTTDSGRRMSSTSTNSDPFSKQLHKWGGQQYQDEKLKWTFAPERSRLGENRMSVERDKNSISSMFAHQSTDSYSLSPVSSSSSAYQDYRSTHVDAKGSTKEKPRPWRGMEVDTTEWWTCNMFGSFKLERSNVTPRDTEKPIQQRITMKHTRPQYYPLYGGTKKFRYNDGPNVTIHKHSKTAAFSLSRRYMPNTGSARASVSSRPPTNPPASTEEKKNSGMIMLSTLTVHEQWTNTNTTRKLESHGYFTEGGRHDPKDLERLQRLERENEERRRREEKEAEERRRKEEREKERERRRAEEAKKAELSKAKAKEKGKSKGGSRGHGSSPESSFGSVTNESIRPGPSHSTRPSVDRSVVGSIQPNSPDRAVVRRGSNQWAFNDSPLDDDEYYDELDELDGHPSRRRPPRRTPHTESFSTLTAEEIERNMAQRPSPGLFGNLRKQKPSSSQPPTFQPYTPPWAVANSRYSDGKGIVQGLNASFQEVGLLPDVGETRNSSSAKRLKQAHPGSGRRHDKRLGHESFSVFHSFPSDYLFMLIPLWPRETDSVTAQRYPCDPPKVPLEDRKFLLVYYKDDEEPAKVGEDGKHARDGGKKRTSPTSSRDSNHTSASNHVFMNKFHFCARVVAYADIQGSGVRSSEEGLTVVGPMSEAIKTMPSGKGSYVDTFQVIGVYTSRERGVEFVPEGLEKLGLTIRIPDPDASVTVVEPVKRFSLTGTEEPDEICDSILVPTPIGRAVMEMAFCGAMALTGFMPQ
ncbi:hypothetical protein DFP72DRAFT_35342 [Ephemerocybe angulata]|uniref:Uncharacterized protein n=1 Tax=Ephemerocybe angulata TaxID=980116 RepID=A0A8H6IBP3_9AGAR|nr:hypothetical protein DFP72DRAFT_35342 [Tulosesus angulatus]